MSREALESLCERDGLTPGEHLLGALGAALVRGSFELAAAAAQLALERGASPTALREVCLQGIAYAGFPRALATFEVVRPLLPVGFDDAAAPDLAQGRSYYDTVYGRHGDKLLARLTELDPALADLTMEVAYGRILCRPGLDGRTRELVAVAMLVVLDQPRQLVAHAWGARNFGASDDAILAAAETAGLLFADFGGRGHVERLRAELGGQ